MNATDEALTQMAHLGMHGWRPHHWHVGVTALDGPPPFPDAINAHDVQTEDVTTWFGLPVYRLLDVSRGHIRCVPREQSSCHWPNGSA